MIFKFIRILWWFIFLKKKIVNDRVIDRGIVMIINYRYLMKYVDDRGLMWSFDVNMLIWNVYYVFLGCGGCICYEICDIKKEILIEIFKRLYVFLILLIFDKNFYWMVFKC